MMTQEQAFQFARELEKELGTFNREDGQRLADFWNRAVGYEMFIVRAVPNSAFFIVIEKGTE